MTRVAAIDIQPRSAKLEDKQGVFHGAFTLSLSNARSRSWPAKIEIVPEGETRAEWISIPEERAVFEFTTDKIEPIPIEIRVPTGSPPGSYGFSVRIQDRDNSDEDYDKLGAIFEIPQVVTPKPPRPKWGLIALVVAGVLLLGGGALALYLVLRGPNLGDACNPEDAKSCPEGVECHPDKKQCLAGLDQPCKKDAHCITERCGEERTCQSLQLGDRCDPTEKLCAAKLECVEGVKRCLGVAGAACEKNEQCVSSKCEGGACAPSSKRPGDPCGVGGDCGDPLLLCDASAIMCKGAHSYVGCRADADCITGRCADQRCVYPEPLGLCAPGKKCPPNQECFAATVSNREEERCFLKPNEPCTREQSYFCPSFVCNARGKCAPSDGSCQDQSDCPAKASCIQSRCKFPNGEKCGQDPSVCESGYCEGGVCKVSPCPTCPRLHYCSPVSKQCEAMVIRPEMVSPVRKFIREQHRLWPQQP